MIVDVHTHCFADSIATNAMAKLAQNSQYPPHFNGTLAGLKSEMALAGIDMAFILNIATNPRQNINVNNWAIESNDIANGIVSFGSIHPLFADYKNEIARLKRAGVKGIKFHPDYQGFFVSDKTVYPVYEEILKNGMVMQFHCGCDLVIREPLHNTPQMFSQLNADFPSSPIIGAHLAGQGLWDDVFKYIVGKNIYIDSSFGFKFLTKQQLKRLLGEHPTDHILFATDSPWQKEKIEVEEFMAIDMDNDTREKIAYKNALHIIGLDDWKPANK